MKAASKLTLEPEMVTWRRRSLQEGGHKALYYLGRFKLRTVAPSEKAGLWPDLSAERVEQRGLPVPSSGPKVGGQLRNPAITSHRQLMVATSLMGLRKSRHPGVVELGYQGRFSIYLWP